ncbi:MAG TPA: DUF1995 family protein [Candidatus Sericytochromatia bacterium]|jgi:hypothetical protein
MSTLPNSLEEAIAQAKEATQAALNDGRTKLQVELVFPEIALQAQSIAQQFLPLFEQMGVQPKVFFPDTGSAALARRDWGTVPFKIDDLGSSRTSMETKIGTDDEAFLLVAPSAVEVAQVEQLSNLAGDRPFILLNPQLEDLYVVGIGLSARKLRDRFLNTIESCYYLRPLNGAAIYRSYPSLWQVWLETEDEYQLIAEEPQRPAGDALDAILAKATSDGVTGDVPPPKKPGFLTNLQRFLNALTR